MSEEPGIMPEEIPGLGDISRADARAVEEVLIEVHGGPEGNQLLNRSHSISKKNAIYNWATERGKSIIRFLGLLPEC